MEDRIKIAIYGAGRGGLTVYETLCTMGLKDNISFFIDDFFSHSFIKTSTSISIPMINDPFMCHKIGFFNKMIIAISSRSKRKEIREKYYYIESISAIHPNSSISESAIIGKGSHIKSGAIIETESKIGICCIIDNNVTIPHHNTIGDFCHLAPGVVLGSSITIGERTLLGIGTCVSTGVDIGQNVISLPMTCIMSDIPDNSLIRGIPAEIIGEVK